MKQIDSEISHLRLHLHSHLLHGYLFTSESSVVAICSYQLRNGFTRSTKALFLCISAVYDRLFNTKFTTTALLLKTVKQKKKFPC